MLFVFLSGAMLLGWFEWLVQLACIIPKKAEKHINLAEHYGCAFAFHLFPGRVSFTW
jgi:uncharacterized protein with PQ loop repeat